jgi:RNA polymerase sigma-70 factor (ECF subfamily)
MRDEERRLILQALEQLPEDQREAVRIRYLDHATLQETAARMGRTEDSVSSLLQRGMKKLNALLRNSGLNE